jgi:rhodanese-related sulfurtransferase
LAAVTLRELGFENATDLIGGFRAWRRTVLPVEK